MHNAAKLAFVLLAAAAPVAAAAQSSNPADDLTAIYDPTPRVTNVSTSLRREAGTESRPLYLAFRTTHPDTVPSRPLEVFELSLSAAAGQSQAPHLAGVDEATLLVDDSVKIALQGQYRAGTGTETVAFPVSLSQALKLSAARSVHGRIGSWEFELAPGEIARIGRLVAYARLEPGAPVPDRWTVSPDEFGGQGPL